MITVPDGAPMKPVSYTYFFRETDALDVVRDQVLMPALAAGKTTSIWCAGCATGEEAYSLAVVAAEVGARVEILATDIKTSLLEHGRQGRYSIHSLRHVSEARRSSWFSTVGRELEVRDRLKAMVRFDLHDVTGDPVPPSRSGRGGAWDVVFLRNVLLYVGDEGKKQALSMVIPSIIPGGTLVLGASEWLGTKLCSEIPAFSQLKLVEAGGVLVYQRRDPRAARRRPTPIRPLPAISREAPRASLPASPRAPLAAPIAQAAPAEPPRADAEIDLLRAEGDSLLDTDEAEAALARYERALARDELPADLHLRRGLCLLRLGRIDDAHGALRQALFLAPKLWPAAWLLGDLCQEVDPKAAIRYFSRARTLLESGADEGLVELAAGSDLEPFLPGRRVALEAARMRLSALSSEGAEVVKSSGSLRGGPRSRSRR